MGPFLATRVPVGIAYWLFGAAAVASAISLATLPDGEDVATPPSGPRLWEQHGCPKAVKQHHSYDDAPRVFVGPMTDGGEHRALLQETTRATIAAHRPDWRVDVTDKPPTDVPGFYLEGTVDELDTTTTSTARAQSKIYCRVSFWLGTQRSNQIRITSGAARVLTSRNPKDVELSRTACIQAVVEDLIETKLIEAIEHPTLDDLTTAPTYRE